MEGSVPIYSISSVARMLGVPVATLRTWEDRYGLVVPERSSSGHRLYNRDQVSSLEFVKLQIDRGVSAADAHRLLHERLQGSARPSTPLPSPDRPHKVVIAENDPYAAEFEEHFLKSEGYQVEITLDVDSAAKAVDDAKPSLVVIEMLLSGGRGLELCRLVKRREASPAVLAVSTVDAPDRALGAGADAFLKKPLERPKFLATVERLLISGSFTDAPAAV
ncbi:MAG TPA: MerR family transcriptional regulator [Actinomycetota bacterium]|nr:MerR family transcriptional regulator [Actinomycetota bacterium]